MDLAKAKEIIIGSIRKNMEESGIDGAVIGISGGIDSALVAYLTVEAIGAENVLGIHMPEDRTPSKETEDAMKVAQALGIDMKVINISGLVDSYKQSIPGSSDATAHVDGNLKARIRMSVLYYHANMMDRIVMGTGNKSEFFMGYFTKYGDGGVDLEPIGDLYKTEVIQMSKQMGVPQSIIDKPPSAGLVEGQTDEADLGVTYENIDRILQPILAGEGHEQVRMKLGIPMEEIAIVLQRIRKNIHKRSMPPIPHLDDLRGDWL